MPVTFNEIAANRRVPGAPLEVDGSKANTSTAALRGLIIGQKLAAGTAVAGVATRVRSLADAGLKFGKDSQLYDMFAAWFANNELSEVWGVGIQDPTVGPVKASATLTIAGTATEAGFVNLYLAGKVYNVPVAVGDLEAEIATNVAAAINAITDNGLDTVTIGGAGSNVLTFTFAHVGVIGNQVRVILNHYAADGTEKTPAGVTLTLSAAQLALGAGTAISLASALGGLAESDFEVWVSGYSDNNALALIDASIAERWTASKKKYGHCFTFIDDTAATLAASGNATNFIHVVKGGMYRTPSNPWHVAAATGARVLRAVQAYAADSLLGKPLTGVIPPVSIDRLNETERQACYMDGIACYIVNGNTVYTERLITNYQIDANGSPDNSYLDSQTLFTAAKVARDVVAVNESFRDYNLVDDDTVVDDGVKVISPSGVFSEWCALYKRQQAAGLVENFPAFAAASYTKRNQSDATRLDGVYAPDFVNAAFIIATLLQFRLQFAASTGV